MSEGLEAEIGKLKRQRNAVILAHNYQLPEVQDIADYAGDSLELSRIAAKVEAEVIVFCGVMFMAETASILGPEKTVLLPARDAGCPLADMIGAEQLRELKRSHPEATVVCYVNTPAEVKAESDYCCTSSNAASVVGSLADAKEIIFVPDRNLGEYVAEQTGREMILWDGYCHVHEWITEDDIRCQKSAYPNATVIAHPECTRAVRTLADVVLSTGGMCRYARTSEADEFIVGTEVGMLHRLKKENPGKQFYPATQRSICPNMKRTNLRQILWSLQEMEYEVSVPPEVAKRARQAVERMVEITANPTPASRE